MNKEKYIGSNKILGLAQEEGKTPMGSEIVKVIFQDDVPPVIMSKPVYDMIATDNPIDPNLFQELRFKLIIPKIRELIAEYHIQGYEVISLLTKTGSTMADEWDRVASYLFTGDDKRWTPGMPYSNFLTFLEADQVIQKIPKTKTNERKSEDNGESRATSSKGN